MDTNKSDDAASNGAGNSGANVAKTTAKADANDTTTSTDGTSADASEDFLLFGAQPSQLFDDIALTIDSLLTEEVSTLPLLPRTLTEQEQRQYERAKAEEGNGKTSKPQTGEEKIVSKLRKAYKKNLDLAEAYCSRNIFTVQHYSKTKRRRILESYLGEDDKNENGGDKDGKTSIDPLPASTFNIPDGELPTPDQIMGMDKEILTTRQRLQQEKQRRVELKRQLDRLNKVSLTLTGVKDSLKKGLGKTSSDEKGGVASMQKLKDSVANAMEGHEELKAWNARAEEVIQILDKIKVEREEGNNLSSASGKPVEGASKVAGREADELGRKRMLEESAGGAGAHGTKEQVASLLNKLRGN